MSYDVGAGGAFGILLSDRDEPEIIKLYEEFRAACDKFLEEHDVFPDHNQVEATEGGDEFLREWAVKFRAALQLQQVTVPVEACLICSVSDGESPGRQVTPTNEWVLGFGIFTPPWQYPPMHESFRIASFFHTWVWGG